MAKNHRRQRLLDKLIAEQAADAQSDRSGRSDSLQLATDLKINPNRWPDLKPTRGPVSVFLEGSPFDWSGDLEPFLGTHHNGVRCICPVCRDQPLKPLHYCARCDRYGLDGKAELPGEPLDNRLRLDWSGYRSALPTRYNRGRLKGGVG